MNDGKSEIRLLLKKIYPYGAVCTVGCFLFTLIWGFRTDNLLGFAVGYGYMCFCYEYLGRSCAKAVSSDKEKAVRLMRVCYFVRFGGLFVLCALSLLTGIASFVGILLPQFFPRIILTAIQFYDKRSRKG